MESSARSLGFRYRCDESEYMELRRLAKKMRLSRRLIQDLDHHYKNVHAVDIPHPMRIGKMNAFIGMGHDACVKGYCDTAMLIEKAL